MVSGPDFDGAVAVGGLHELADGPAGLCFDPAANGQSGEHDAQVGFDEVALVMEDCGRRHSLGSYSFWAVPLRTTLPWRTPFLFGGWSLISILLKLCGSTALVMEKIPLPLFGTRNVPADALAGGLC